MRAPHRWGAGAERRAGTAATTAAALGWRAAASHAIPAPTQAPTWARGGKSPAWGVVDDDYQGLTKGRLGGIRPDYQGTRRYGRGQARPESFLKP